VTFTGVASPVRAGSSVALQRKVHGSWHTIKVGRFSSGSTSTTSGARYSLRVKVTWTGSQQFRAIVPADAGRSTGTSPVVTMSVFRVAITGVHATGDERVTIKNRGSVAVQLEGWVLRTGSHHRATLPAYSLAPGDTLQIHTGHGTSHGHDLYLRGAAMLGDRHDVVKLDDAAGRKVARYSY
jgi:hypothetical protein